MAQPSPGPAGRRRPPAAVAALACPVCGEPLVPDEAGTPPPGGLTCAAGHRFDAARQGYVHLAARPIRHPGDTAAMVAARERVLAAGVLDAVTAGLAAAVVAGLADGGAGPGGGAAGPVVLDVGAGTGHHLAAVLDALDPSADRAARRTSEPERTTTGGVGAARAAGIALDTSKPALRRAARAHPAVIAVAADATGRLPIRDGAVHAALIAFAPRAADELARVLAPGGALVVATPEPGHLAELRAPLGTLEVGEGKADAVRAALGAAFDEVGAAVVGGGVEVDRATAADLALMGPTGFHATAAELAERAAALAPSTAVTVAVRIARLRRR